MVTQCVALQPILRVCTSKMGYKGGGRKQRSCCRQLTTKGALWNTFYEAAHWGGGGEIETAEGGRDRSSRQGVKG